MPELIKYTLEFPINSSINTLYLRLSSSSGLSEWFADDVIIKEKIYTFIWGGIEQQAKVLKKKNNGFIRFRWVDSETTYDYFEFLIQVDEITSDVSLLITDFAEDNDEKEEQSNLWNKQITSLKQVIGS